MKRIISVVASMILLLNMSLAYTTQITINGGGIITTSEEGNSVRIIPKVGIEGWVVEEGDVDLNEEANSVASFTMPNENVAISNLILGVNSPNTLAPGKTWYTKGTTIEKSSITSINIEDSYTPESTPVASWDASAMGDGTVMAYVEDDNLEGDTYKLTIAGDGTGKIYANVDSSMAFEHFGNVTQIIGFEDAEGRIIYDTSKAINMLGMFSGCTRLTGVDVSGFETENVTNMYAMFADCTNITNLDLSGFDTGNVTNMSGMFARCNNLINLTLNDFDTSEVIDMSIMFIDCNSLTSLDLSDFDTGNVTNMALMFNGCSNLTNLEIGQFDTSKVTDMSCMFYNCNRLASLNVSGFSTDNVTDMHGMFSGCSSLETIDVSRFNTSKVTDMHDLFKDATSLTSVNVSGFDTSKVTDMVYMFYNCSNLTSLNLSNFDTRGIVESTIETDNNGNNKHKGLYYFAYGTNSLTEIILGEKFAQSTNILEWGIFYAENNVNTTVTGANTVMTNYAWDSDNRTVTFN